MAGLLSLLLALVTLRAVLLLPERCERPALAAVDAAVSEAVAWFERNQQVSGRFTYDHDVRAGDDLPGYNLVRHAGVLVALYQAAGAGWEDALEIGDRGLDHALDSLVRREGWAAFGTADADLRTGATALLAVALTLRQDATGDERHAALLTELGRFLVVMQGPDGRIHEAWSHDTGAPIPGEYSPFFTGETLWALVRLHMVDPSRDWDRAAARTARYLVQDRDELEDWFPPISDHWGAYSFADMTTGWAGDTPPLDDDVRDWVRRQSHLFGVQVRFESQRTGRGWNGLVRGGPARGGGVGTLGEGLAGLRTVAATDERLADLRGVVDERLHCVAGLLVSRQVGGPEASETASPDVAHGAWLHQGTTRMDDQQHALSALLLARSALGEAGSTDGAGGDDSESDAGEGTG